MDNKKIIILMGAGFSKDAGIPLEKELWEKSLEIYKDTKQLRDVHESWLQLFHYKLPDDMRVEELLTMIDLQINSHRNNEATKQKAFELRLAVLQMLAHTFRQSIKSKLPDDYKLFVKLYHEQAIFFTLNYDLLVENLLIEIGNEINLMWSYGFGTEVDHFGIGRQERYIKNEQRDFNNVFKYHKLHGSFNWHVCWRCGKARVSDFKHYGISGFSHSGFILLCEEDECIKDKNDQAQLDPLVIPPSAIKAYTLPIFRELWFAFDDLLKVAEKIIVIGCSLRDEDVLLWQALSKLTRKNPHLKDLVVVDPDKKIVEKFSNVIGIRARHFESLESFVLCHY